MWCNFKFIITPSELIAYWSVTQKQTVMTVAQWHRSEIIRGLWLLAKKKVAAYVVQF
jgi:hypothetical protein